MKGKLAITTVAFCSACCFIGSGLSQHALAAELAVTPNELDFGNTGLYSPIKRTITLANTGPNSLSVSTISVGGQNSDNFPVGIGGDSPCSSLTPTIAAGGSCTVAVTFDPYSVGVKEATLSIASNAVMSPTIQLPLGGVGDDPTLTLTLNGTGRGTLNYTYTLPGTSQQIAGSCSNDCKLQLPFDTVLTVNPGSGANSSFVGWEGCPQPNGSQCGFTLAQDTHLLATFHDTTPNAGTLQLVGITIPSADLNKVAVDPTSPNTVITAGETGIYRSTDNFLTYTAAGGRIFAPLAIDPVDPKRVYAGSSYVLSPYGYLLESADGGKTFGSTAIGSVTSIALDPADHTTIYVGTDAGLYRKQGGSIQPLPTTSLTSRWVNTLGFASTGVLYAGTWGGGLYRTLDKGTTWTPLTVNGDRYVNRVVVHPADPATVFVSTNIGGYISRDGGVSWSALPATIGSFADVEFVQEDSTSVYVLGSAGIYLSRDRGNTWSQVAPVATNRGNDIALIPGTSPQQLYAVVSPSLTGFLYKSAPLGLSVTPGIHNFGTVNTHNASASRELTLTNNSPGSPVTIAGLELTGGASEHFSHGDGLVNPCAPPPYPLSPGSSCTVRVGFDPSTIGKKTTTFVIRSDDPAYPLLGIPLSALATATPPVGTITILEKPVVGAPSVTATLSASDETGTTTGMRFRTSSDGRSWSQWTDYSSASPVSIGLPVGDGPKTVYVQYQNAAGAISKLYSDAVTLETKAPAITLVPKFATVPISGGPGSALTNSTFTLTADEPVQRFECSLDGAGFSPCTASPVFATPHGPHTFVARAVDLADKTGAAATYAWDVDAVPPQTTITSAPTDATDVYGASFSFIADEQVQRFECRLDSRPFSTCSTGVGYANLSAGYHSFEVRGRDLVGNMESPSRAHSWTIFSTGNVELKRTGNLDSFSYHQTIGESLGYFLPAVETGAMRLLGQEYVEDVSIQNFSSLTVTGGVRSFSGDVGALMGNSKIRGNLQVNGGAISISAVDVAGKVTVSSGTLQTDGLIIL